MTSLSHSSASYSPTCSGSKIATTTPIAACATYPWPPGRRPASSVMVRLSTLQGSGQNWLGDQFIGLPLAAGQWDTPKLGRLEPQILVLLGYLRTV